MTTIATSTSATLSNEAEDSSDEFFNIDHLKAGLGRRSAVGGVVTLCAQAMKFALALLVNIGVARVVSPTEYGLVGMATAVTGLIAIFKDLGLSSVTIQTPHLTQGQVSKLFWINVLVGILTAAIAATVAPVLGFFYARHEVALITLALAGGFLISGLGVQHLAILARQMRFGAIASIELTAAAVSVAIAFILAWEGAGFWSLVALELSRVTLCTAGGWIACRWKPNTPFKPGNVKALLTFGGHLTGFQLLNHFSRNADNVLIGWRWGPVALGYYSKSYQLLLLPITQVNGPVASVAIPMLSRFAADHRKFVKSYLYLIFGLAAVTMPIVAVMFILAADLIPALLGEQWSSVVPLFKIFAVVGFFQPVASSAGWLFISKGLGRQMLIWGVIGSVMTVLSFLIGLPWGSKGVAIAYAITYTFIHNPLLMLYVQSHVGVRAIRILTSILPAFVATIVALGIMAIVTSLVNWQDGPWRSAISACSFFSLYTVIIMLFPQSRNFLLAMWELRTGSSEGNDAI